MKLVAWRITVTLFALVCGAAAWHGLDGFARRLAEQRLEASTQAVSQAITSSLGRLQTRVLIENARYADGRAEFADVARAVGNDAAFVSRIETRDRSGGLQQAADLGGAPRLREQMGAGGLMSFVSAVAANTVVLSSPYAVRDAAGNYRSYVDLFSPIGRSDQAYLVVRLSLEALLDEAVRAALPGLTSGLNFRFGDGARGPGDSAGSESALRRTMEVRYADLSLTLIADNRNHLGPELEVLRWTVALLSVALGLLIPLLVRNVLVRRQAQRDLRLVEEKVQIEARFATLGEMSVAIAHELNQPLAAIENFAFTCERMLQRPNPDPVSLRTGLTEIRAQAKRSADVIRSIRQFVRRREAPAALVDVAEVLDSLKLMLEMQANSMGCRLEIECNPGVRLWCQRTLLEQVTLNLARNGLEAMTEITGLRPEDKALRIKAEAVVSDPFSANALPDRLRLRVSDRGHGVSHQAAEQIFKPFFSTKENGLGIGLSLCQSMVEREGGTLGWENNPNGGATFTLELPIQDGPLATSLPEQPGTTEHTTKHHAGTMTRILRRSGAWRVSTGRGGATT